MTISLIFGSSQVFSQSAEELFPKAIQLEEVKGELEKAIEVYQIIIAKFPDNRPIAAKAQFHIGLCYEKLGLRQAQKAYREVVNNYPDQQGEVAMAKERLARLIKIVEKVSKAPLVPKFTQVKIPTGLSWNQALSPDGKNLAFVEDKKVWIMPLSGNIGPEISGSPVQLNTDGIEAAGPGLSWSADGNWIAFNEDPTEEITKGGNNRNQSMYVVSSKGGIPKEVYETYRDQRNINYRMSLSPDGKTLAFSSVNLANEEQHIYTIPVDGGSPKQLVDAQAREPVFSPNGKMIAFVEDKFMGRGGGDLWVVPAEGGIPNQIADAVNASSPVWSPNGDVIAFLDSGKKGSQINLIPIGENGKAAGDLITIYAPEGIDGIWHLSGWSPDNKIAAIFEKNGETGLYTLPTEGGKALQVARGGGQPQWSSDRKRIFCVDFPNEKSGAWQGLAIGSIPAEGGSFTTVPLQSDAKMYIPYFGVGNKVSPDRKTILFTGKTQYDPIHFLHNHIWTLPVVGGLPEQLTETPLESTDMFPCWSPDGKTIAFVRTRIPENIGEVKDYSANIYIVQADGGKPTSLTTQSDSVTFGPIEWSPDGKFIAFTSLEDGDAPDFGNLKIISSKGDGKSRVIGKKRPQHPGIQFAWSPDSKHIAFVGPDGQIIKVISLDNGSIVSIQTGLTESTIGDQLDWSPDGERFVFVGGTGESNELWLMENFLPLDKLPQIKEEEDKGFNINQVIRADNELYITGAPSPDGRYISFVNNPSGILGIVEIATGKKLLLTNNTSWDESDGVPQYSRWSPDSKQIVYDWYNKKDFIELRIIGIDGSKPRILYKNENVAWARTYGWSPDGKQILACFDRKDGVEQIVLVSVDNGSVRVLKTLEKEWPENMNFSPDGRYIVYDLKQKENSSEHDIFLMSSDGSREIPLVENPADDYLLGWAPDGENILFASDRTGNLSSWLIAVANGKPQGTPKLVKPGIEQSVPLGFTSDGSFYYTFGGEFRRDIFSVRIDPESGEILNQPKKLIESFEGHNLSPDYSPDGKYLVYVRRMESDILCIRSIETGEEREFKLKLNPIDFPRWSPDGNSILIAGRDNNGFKLYQVDVQTGKLTALFSQQENHYVGLFEWSPDGKSIFYGRPSKTNNHSQIIHREIESGTEKELYLASDNKRFHFSCSPDGKWLSFFIRGGTDLRIIPVEGGESRKLFNCNQGDTFSTLRWTADGKYILFVIRPPSDHSNCTLWRIPAEGGEPEKLGLDIDLIAHMSVHPDGQHIAFYNFYVRKNEVWKMENFLPKNNTKK